MTQASSPLAATQAFADFSAGLTHSSLPDAVRRDLTIFLLDYLRVASLGKRMPWSNWATALAHSLGGNAQSTLLFSSERTDPERATFVNATYAGSIDADDVHVGSMLHPGCIVISAARSGRRQDSSIVVPWRSARYSGSERPACRMNQTGSCSGRWPR